MTFEKYVRTLGFGTEVSATLGPMADKYKMFFNAGRKAGLEEAKELVTLERLSSPVDDTDEAYERALDHVTEAILKRAGEVG